MNARIACQGLWKSYRTCGVREVKALFVGRDRLTPGGSEPAWAVRDLSLEATAGEAVGVMGPNGSGKTTLLSCLYGSLKPDRGKVERSGTTGSFLDLGSGLHPELTGRENIFLFGSIRGQRISEMRPRLDAIVDFAGLGDAIDDPVRTYSSGMLARLGFSTLTQIPAEIMLVDEMLAVGDLAFRAKCGDWTRDFLARGGAMVIVSHSLRLIHAVCRRMIWVEHGAVVDQGPVDEVLGRRLPQRPDLVRAPAPAQVGVGTP